MRGINSPNGVGMVTLDSTVSTWPNGALSAQNLLTLQVRCRLNCLGVSTLGVLDLTSHLAFYHCDRTVANITFFST